VRALARAAVRATAFIRALGDERRAPAPQDTPADAEHTAVAVLGGPPEPHDRALIVRATHVEAPPAEESERYAAADLRERRLEDERERSEIGQPDDRDESPAGARIVPETDRPAARRGAKPDPGELTPMGRLRESATDDPRFEWKLPNSGTLLTRSS